MDQTRRPDREGSKLNRPASGSPRSPEARNRIDRRALARWTLVGALGALFAFFVVAIALQATRLTPVSWLIAIALLLPIGGALVALIWYGRSLGGAVAERARSERALAQSEAKFRGLIRSAPDGIFVVDPGTTILDVNPAGEALIGRPRPQVVGRSLTEFIPAERVPIARQYFADRLDGLRATELYEGVWLAASGRKMHVQLTSQVVRPQEAEPYLVVSVRDVSKERDMQRKLLESERWASMGRLASYVAHEINTPLTNISLLAASVSRRVTDPEIQERLRKIGAQGKIAANITSELLRFARPGAINPVETNLVDLARGAVEQADAFRKPGTELRTEWPERPVMCHVDPLRMQEVVVNLLKNAYDATPNGHVTVRLQERGDIVAIAVADTGTGIPPEVQARLFEAFYTTKKKGEGTGLGLAISRNFVVSHGGEILVASEVNRGSTFTVLLPRRPPSTD